MYGGKVFSLGLSLGYSVYGGKAFSLDLSLGYCYSATGLLSHPAADRIHVLDKSSDLITAATIFDDQPGVPYKSL